jgi:hypothetical protein
LRGICYTYDVYDEYTTFQRVKLFKYFNKRRLLSSSFKIHFLEYVTNLVYASRKTLFNFPLKWYEQNYAARSTINGLIKTIKLCAVFHGSNCRGNSMITFHSRLWIACQQRTARERRLVAGFRFKQVLSRGSFTVCTTFLRDYDKLVLSKFIQLVQNSNIHNYFERFR